jgi:hypothetical protein
MFIVQTACSSIRMPFLKLLNRFREYWYLGLKQYFRRQLNFSLYQSHV